MPEKPGLGVHNRPSATRGGRRGVSKCRKLIATNELW